MLIIAVANSKGGSGKSTVSINLSVAAVLVGMKVMLIDCDPQGTAKDWGERRTQEGPTVAAHDLRELRASLAAARAGGYDLVLIDVAGRDDAGLFRLFEMVDFVLVPSAPFNIELSVTKPVRRMVAAADRRSRIVLVKTTDPHSRRTRRLIEERPDHFAAVALRYLVAYPDSYARGEGVQETYPESVAATEVAALLDYVLHQVGGGRDG